MNESKNYKIQITVPEIQKEDLPPGTNTKICIKCNRTCLEETNFPDERKRYCPNFDKNGYCIKCPGKCYWNMHKNIPYKFVYKTKQVEKIIEELKEKYTDAKNQLSTSQQMVDRMEKELMEYENECLEIQENIKNNLNNLEKIALNKDSHELTEKYLTNMIINERNEKKEGYNDRIKVLIEFQNNIKKII